jgi:hypothetical protein
MPDVRIHYGQSNDDGITCNFQGECPACTVNAVRVLNNARKYVRQRINEWEYYGEQESLIPHLKVLLRATGGLDV